MSGAPGAHGAVSGDFVTFSGAASLGGNITAAVLNQEYNITEVLTDNTCHNFQVECIHLVKE